MDFPNELLKKERWLCLLVITANEYVNRERVESVADINGKETLHYVLRSLSILEEEFPSFPALHEREKCILQRTLQWSEVSKGGSIRQRKLWKEKGYPLSIHNLASAGIYEDFSEDDPEMTSIVSLLIATHGAVGQSIRGEVPIRQNARLAELKNFFPEETACELLYLLNLCIIKAVSTDLWSDDLASQVREICHAIIREDLADLEPQERLMRLLEIYRTCPSRELSCSTALFSERIFPYYELWYFNSALLEFSPAEIDQIMKKILACDDLEGISYLSFKPLQDTLYYDYEGKKRINVYKKRIIENCLKTGTNDNVRLKLTRDGCALLVDYEFSRVCEKLIDFCVEAERSGILTFEKSITVLYDMFGFRRDEFDRLNNEEKYLAVMNDSEESTKNSIIDYAVGHTIVDVGSGGGVLLDLLERTYPDRKIVGTDISENVIQILREKAQKEKHQWIVLRHNFVEGPLTEAAPSTIIFSSILHEVFSYTQTEQGRFQIDSVKKALQHAYDSLSPGGRIIIRDGVKSPSDTDHPSLAFSFREQSGMDFFHNYCHDFKGLPEVDRASIRTEGLHVEGDYNFLREFLYTYTWGTESYSCEVNEQFGYFTLEEFKEYFTGLGARILKAEQFVEPGYIEHLTPLVTLPAEDFPMSNCILVVEK